MAITLAFLFTYIWFSIVVFITRVLSFTFLVLLYLLPWKKFNSQMAIAVEYDLEYQ